MKHQDEEDCNEQKRRDRRKAPRLAPRQPQSESHAGECQRASDLPLKLASTRAPKASASTKVAFCPGRSRAVDEQGKLGEAAGKICATSLRSDGRASVATASIVCRALRSGSSSNPASRGYCPSRCQSRISVLQCRAFAAFRSSSLVLVAKGRHADERVADVSVMARKLWPMLRCF